MLVPVSPSGTGYTVAFHVEINGRYEGLSGRGKTYAEAVADMGSGQVGAGAGAGAGVEVGDDVIDAKTRSMMNLSMIGALGKMSEWETHCRGALNNGVSRDEIRAIIHVIGIYAGVPQALECFRAAKKVIDQD